MRSTHDEYQDPQSVIRFVVRVLVTGVITPQTLATSESGQPKTFTTSSGCAVVLLSLPQRVDIGRKKSHTMAAGET